jgi:hypothetical protein
MPSRYKLVLGSICGVRVCVKDRVCVTEPKLMFKKRARGSERRERETGELMP